MRTKLPSLPEASGLGRATAEKVIAAGGKVAIFDLNEQLANATAEALGPSAKAFAVNVSDEESVKAAVAGTLEAFGAIHINVNCAGVGAAASDPGSGWRHAPGDLQLCAWRKPHRHL